MKKISVRQKITLIVFGIFLFFILFEVGLRVGGIFYLSLQEYKNIKTLKEKGEYRILCLGESTTANQWPGPLEDILNQSNLGIKFSVIDKGIPGTNTGAILTHLNRYIDTYKPHMVVSMIGINDTANIFLLPYQDKTILKHLRVYKLLMLLKLYISQRFNPLVSPFYKKGEKRNVTIPKNANRTEVIKLEEKNDEKNEKDALSEKEYIELGQFWEDHGKHDKAEEVFKKVVKINHKSEKGYLELGCCYVNQGKYAKAEKVLKEAIKINPKGEKGYIELGCCYVSQGKFDLAEAALKEAIKINPKNEGAYNELGWRYEWKGELNKAEAMFNEVVKINPKNEYAIHHLTICKQNILSPHRKNTNKPILGFYSPLTVINYNKIKSLVRKRNIKMVCVQYPMRSVEPLKSIFKDREGMVFVDNEAVFKDALKEGNRKEYFIDMFGGDFGHCTFKGNQLLANNIAETILEKYFYKK